MRTMLVFAMGLLCACSAVRDQHLTLGDILGDGEATAYADPTPASTPAPVKPLACYDNLCGMDSYCSCHNAKGSGELARCWSQREDCAVDLKCCQQWHAGCAAQGTDQCSSQTSTERKKRDAAAAAAPAPKPPTVAPAGRIYLSIPLTVGPPDIPDCNDGELMVDTLQRHLWVCTHKVWWKL